MSLVTNDGGGSRRARRLLILVAILVLLVVALVVGLLVGSKEKKTQADSPATSPRPSTSSSHGPSSDGSGGGGGGGDVGGSLPDPKAVKNGVSVGYPHTTMGAVAAAARYLQSLNMLAPKAQLDRYVEATAAADDQKTAKENAEEAGRQARKALDAPADGLVPNNTYYTLAPKEYIVRAKSPDKVEVWLLTEQDRAKNGEDPEVTIDAWPNVMTWEDGDWKQSNEQAHDKPDVTEPNTSEAADAGWRKLVFKSN